MALQHAEQPVRMIRIFYRNFASGLRQRAFETAESEAELLMHRGAESTVFLSRAVAEGYRWLS